MAQVFAIYILNHIEQDRLMNYFIVALLCVTAGIAGGIVLSKCNPRLASEKVKKLVWILPVVFFSVYLLLGFYRYYAMYYGLWDFGIYDSMLHNMVSNQGFMRDFRGPFDHFSPAVVLLVPFYWLFDSPLWLIVFQPLILAAAAIPLYYLAQHYFRKPVIPLLLSTMYLLNPYYSRLLLYDFHIECLYPLIFFSAWLLHSRGRRWWFMVVLLCTPLIKEDFIVPLGACGLFLCSRKKTIPHGIICIAASGLWTIFVLKVWFPEIMAVKYIHYDRFPVLFGATLTETVRNGMIFISQGMTVNSVAVMVSLLLPFAFLPLLSWRVFLLLLCPAVGIQFFSTFFHQQLLMSHYCATAVAVIPVAAVFGARHIRPMRRWWLRRLKHKDIAPAATSRNNNTSRHYVWHIALMTTLVTHIVFCELPGVKFYNYVIDYRPKFQFGILSIPLWRYWFLNFEHMTLFHEMRSEIPPGLSITAQNNLGYFFIRTNQVYSIPGPTNGSDLYLFDAKMSIGDHRALEMNNLVNWLRANPRYDCVFAKDGLYLFSRIHGTANKQD